VETHVSSVLRKLQLSSRHELTAWALERRLLWFRRRGSPRRVPPIRRRGNPRRVAPRAARARSRRPLWCAGGLGCVRFVVLARAADW